MKIALLHNPRPAEIPQGQPDDAFEEYDSPRTVAAIGDALEQAGVRVEPVVADARLPWRLEAGRYDFAFNIAEGAGRRCREAIPAAVCEMMALPFTGSDALTLAITLDKMIARRVVSPEVPVAGAILVDGADESCGFELLSYPVIVKPNDEGSSKGIRDDAVAANATDAIRLVRSLQADYGCPVLVEEFLPGAEVTVGIVGNQPAPRVLGTMEIAPVDADRPFIYSLDVKRDYERRVRYHVPPRLAESTLAELRLLALTAYRLLGCRDFARMDFRLDAEGRPRLIECNPLPGLNPDHSDLVILSRDTIGYAQLVQGILRDAAGRYGVALP